MPVGRSGRGLLRFLADEDARVGDEAIVRYGEVLRRWPFADAAGRIVVRAVAGAEPAAIVAALVAGMLAKRNAAKMRANADQDQPLRLAFLVARLVRLRVGHRSFVVANRARDRVGRAVVDEDGRAPPLHRNALAWLH